MEWPIKPLEKGLTYRYTDATDIMTFANGVIAGNVIRQEFGDAKTCQAPLCGFDMLEVRQDAASRSQL